MKRRKIKLVALSFSLAMSLITGCGNSSYVATDSYLDSGAYSKAEESYVSDDIYQSEMADAEYANETSTESGTVDAQAENVASNRKLIKRVSLSVETQEFDVLTSRIEARINELGGYVENSSVTGAGYSGSKTRSASYTARIPSNKLDLFVTSVAENSNVTNKTETATDVTLDYVDTQSRKEALKVEQERMMELLEKAEDLDTIIGLEQRLTNIRYELQSYESQIRTYDNLVDYATVTIEVREVKVYTPVETIEKSDWQRMTEGFTASVKNVLEGIKNFLIGLVIALPYLVVWGLVIAAIVFVGIKIFRGSEKRREKRAERKRLKAEKKAAKKAAKNAS